MIDKKKIGIVGGGQLGRMMAQAAQKLGFEVIVLDPTPNSPAGQVTKQMLGDFKDPQAIRDLAAEVDFMTFEIESANAQALEELAEKGLAINPSAKTLALIKDKFTQKEFLRSNHIPVAEAVAVQSKEDVLLAAQKFGYPFLLKARFDAYDGRGNFLVQNESQIDQAMAKLSKSSLYIEKFVPFVKELAVIAARGMNGEIKTYPVVETIHKNNICHIVIAPAPVDAEAQNKARELGSEVMQHLKGVGVFAIEMFLTADGKVWVNEIAPRVHNSGHLTIEAARTSQFEQHIRAITGMELGPTELMTPAAVMINVLGERSGQAEVSGLEEVLAMPQTAVHIYGKMETRPERKMGHITVLGTDWQSLVAQAQEARKKIAI